MKRTHHGKFLGIPVWLDMTDETCPWFEVKFGFIGELVLDVAEFLFGCAVFIRSIAQPDFEPSYKFEVLKPVIAKKSLIK